MKTLKLSECGLSSAVLECAGVLRQRGAVAALPTETVYGLVCRWDDPEGVAEIYQLKQRDGRKPLSMFALDVEVALWVSGYRIMNLCWRCCVSWESL